MWEGMGMGDGGGREGVSTLHDYCAVREASGTLASFRYLVFLAGSVVGWGRNLFSRRCVAL